MPVLMFDKENYTGGKGKVIVNKAKKTLTYNGDTFKFTESVLDDADMTIETVTLDADDLNLKAVKATHKGALLSRLNDNQFTVYRYDIARADENAFAALGKRLAMIM